MAGMQAMYNAKMETAPLKLRARHPEDFRVLSTLLQDALIPAREMTYQKDQRRFVAVAIRFRWERAQLNDVPRSAMATDSGETDARFADVDGQDRFERTHCGLCFDGVKSVRRRGFSPSDPRALLNLLAITYDGGGVTLEFSGGAAVRLIGARICCHMEDLGEAWPTQWRPSHSEATLDDDGEAR